MIDYESYILQALQLMVKAAVGQGSNTTPVKYVGTNIVPPSLGFWWEIVYIPNNLTNEFWSDGKTFQGIMRLILHCKQDNEGGYLPFKELARVSDQIKKGNLYRDPANTVTVKIEDHPNATGVIEQSPESLLPLTLRYSCFKVS